MKGKTIVFEGKVYCPNCKKRSIIRVERETITPAEPAETQTTAKLEADDQTELEGS